MAARPPLARCREHMGCTRHARPPARGCPRRMATAPCPPPGTNTPGGTPRTRQLRSDCWRRRRCPPGRAARRSNPRGSNAPRRTAGVRPSLPSGTNSPQDINRRTCHCLAAPAALTQDTGPGRGTETSHPPAEAAAGGSARQSAPARRSSHTAAQTWAAGNTAGGPRSRRRGRARTRRGAARRQHSPLSVGAGLGMLGGRLCSRRWAATGRRGRVRGRIRSRR